MAGAFHPKDRRSARVETVERHIRLENQHNLEGVLGTFGDTARYDDEPWDEKIYYDRATVLRQLGVFHESQTLLGQIGILAMPAAVFRADGVGTAT